MSKSTVSNRAPVVNTGAEEIAEKTQSVKNALPLVAYERRGNPRFAWVKCADGQYMRATTTDAESIIEKASPEMAGLREPFLIDAVYDRLICKAGIKRIDNNRILILRHTPIIWPAKIDLNEQDALKALESDLVGGIFKKSLGEEQLKHFCAVLTNEYQRLTEWQSGAVRTFCPALCLLGVQGAGKTLIISILRRLLGGGNDISDFMRGDSAFLPDIQSSALLHADDAREELSTFQRRQIMTVLKQLLASDGFSINRKNKEKVTLKLPWLAVIAGNKAQALPLYESGDEHKIVGLWLPEPVDLSTPEQIRLENALRDRSALARLAGLCYAVAKGLPRDGKIVDKGVRQIAAGWVAPDIKAALAEVSPAEHVGNAILAAVMGWPPKDASDLVTGVSMRALRVRARDAADSQTRRQLPVTEAEFKRLAEEWLARQGVTVTTNDKGHPVYVLQKIWQSIQTH